MVAVIADAASLILWAHAHTESEPPWRRCCSRSSRRRLGAEQHVALSNRAVRTSPAGFRFNFMLVNLGIGFGVSSRRASSTSSPGVLRHPLHLQRGHHSDGRFDRPFACGLRGPIKELRDDATLKARVGARCCVIVACDATCSRPSSDDRRLRLPGSGLQSVRGEQLETADSRDRIIFFFNTPPSSALNSGS